jgi:hypothetical protein
MKWSGAAVVLAAISVHGVGSQPMQFKANLKMHNGSDGSNSTGVMYFGGAKMRMELSSEGRSIVILTDPAAQSQYMIMPNEKMYMQMPIGGGPFSAPVTGPTDPTNPCSSGGNTDCVKGPNETISGYETVRWDYTTKEGTKTKAWVSTQLRFPIKTTDAKGSSTELSDIVEGPQPATLFAVPAGFTKMSIPGRGN